MALGLKEKKDTTYKHLALMVKSQAVSGSP